MKMNKTDTPERIIILNNIFGYFQQIIQWLPNHIDKASKYMYNTESLIALLEINDCGSVGGFDRTNKVLNESGFSLYNRFLALVRKYNNEKEIKVVSGIDLNDLKNYFLELSELHDKIISKK